MRLKTGKLLWDTIEEAARKKHNVGKDYTLTMVDMGHPHRRNAGTCEYRINNDKEKSYYQGFVEFDPYITE